MCTWANVWVKTKLVTVGLSFLVAFHKRATTLERNKQLHRSQFSSLSQSCIVLHGAVSLSISRLISLLQPTFGLDFKWKTITQIPLLFLTLGKIRRVFQWRAIIKWQIMHCLHWCQIFNCWNWSHMWIAVVLQNTFPRWGSTMQRSKAWYVWCMGTGPHTLQANALSAGRRLV